MPAKKFPTPKKQGEWAEQAFILKALGLDIIVSRPVGDSSPYDAMCDGPITHWPNRVQVKSVTHRRPDGFYCAHAAHFSHLSKAYTAEDIDFLVLYVIPEEVWYIIPVEELTGADTICVRPKCSKSRSRFEPFREAWDLLL
jgi:hypothetical protein